MKTFKQILEGMVSSKSPYESKAAAKDAAKFGKPVATFKVTKDSFKKEPTEPSPKKKQDQNFPL